MSQFLLPLWDALHGMGSLGLAFCQAPAPGLDGSAVVAASLFRYLISHFCLSPAVSRLGLPGIWRFIGAGVIKQYLQEPEGDIKECSRQGGDRCELESPV